MLASNKLVIVVVGAAFAALLVSLPSCNGLVGFSELEKVSCAKGNCAAVDAGAGLARVVTVGRKTSCALLEDKTVACWGANPGAQPGTVVTQPVRVAKLTEVSSVVIGLEHACALSGAGIVSCWGRNEHGQLGDGTTQQSVEPKVVGGLPVVETITVGSTHSCAYTSVEVDPVQAFCWGQNESGQLGNGLLQDSSTPVKVNVGTGAEKIFRLGPASNFTCGIIDNAGTLETWCWGKNDKGQCGQDPVANPIVLKPTKIEGLPQLERVYPGADHMCARTVGEKLPYCWGANDRGQIGINATSASEKPRPVLGTGRVDTIHAGAHHNCLIKDGSLEAFCWGANEYGQFGDPPSGDRLLAAASPYLDPKSTSFSMRQAEHGCRLLEGVVSCWGANDSGQLGNGKTAQFNTPVQVQLF